MGGNTAKPEVLAKLGREASTTKDEQCFQEIARFDDLAAGCEEVASEGLLLLGKKCWKIRPKDAWARDVLE